MVNPFLVLHYSAALSFSLSLSGTKKEEISPTFDRLSPACLCIVRLPSMMGNCADIARRALGYVIVQSCSAARGGIALRALVQPVLPQGGLVRRRLLD
ncbi:MAG: hypothetical protein ACI4PG_05160 [Candidatus Ventricola sp.]